MSVASMNSDKQGSARPLTVDEYAEACRELITLDNGHPLELEGFQLDIVGDLLSGVRELHIRIPEENGKTTLLAAIALIHLLSTPDPRVSIGARNKDQAKVLYHQALKMVAAHPSLSDRLDMRDGTNEIRIRGVKGGAGLRVIPADELTAHGGINTLVVLDEMHALPGIGLYRTLAGKIGKRPGAQIVTISTAGEPDSEYEQLWANIVATADTVESRGPRCLRAEGPHHVAWGWALEAEDDPNDMALVKLANPASWITVDSLVAKRALPSWELRHWLTVVCDRPTRDFVSRFLQEGDWDAADVSADCPSIPEGVPIFVGTDWGLSDDATVYQPLWFDENGDQLLGAPVIIEPPRNGHDLTHAELREALRAIDVRNPITVFAHDSELLGPALIGIVEELLPNATIVDVSRADMNRAPRYFSDQLRAGRLKHTGDADLKRHLMNAVKVPIRDDPENFRIARPVKSRHSPHMRTTREKDAADAAVIAVWGAIGREPPLDPGLYAQAF